MTPAEILAALTPAQRHGFAFWTSILDALIPPVEPPAAPIPTREPATGR